MLDFDRSPDTGIRTRALGATWASAGFHAALAVLVTVIVGGNRLDDAAMRGAPTDPPLAVWLDQPGGPKGGGFGDRSREAAPRAQRPGTAAATIPALVAASLTTRPEREPPLQQIDIPAIPEASGLREIPGDVATVSIVGVSTKGPGDGDGARDGVGDGIHPGPGGNSVGGMGGPGAGGSSPQLIRQVRPNYTSSALQARVQGLVVMDAVVLPDGSVGDVKIVRSLDRTFGLDQEAIKAVKQWRFRAGTRAGQAVPMLVSVEMVFELR